MPWFKIKRRISIQKDKEPIETLVNLDHVSFISNKEGMAVLSVMYSADMPTTAKFKTLEKWVNEQDERRKTHLCSRCGESIDADKG